MQKDDLKTILFAGVVCVICSLLLSSVSAALKERQDINVENDRKSNVLTAFGVKPADAKKFTPEEIEGYFKANIREVLLDENLEMTEAKRGDEGLLDEVIDEKDKAPYPLYIWKDAEGVDTMYCYPQNGSGLWSVVYSYIALKADLASVQGATFFGHAETPGLGGEVSKPWFQNQFTNVVLFADGEQKDFRIKQTGGVDQYSIDGMGGATITGRGVQDFVNEEFAKYNKYFSKIRN